MTDTRIADALAWLGEGVGKLMIGNVWIAGSGAMASISPSTGAAFADISLAGDAEVDAAVSGARAALGGEWASALPAQRARLMLRLADLIEANVEHLAAIEAADGVRPYVEALYGDVPTGAAIVRYMAGLAGAIEGTVKYPSIGYAPPGMAVRAFVDKGPVGVVAAIIPWNFPFIMACARIAPALSAGCTVVLKPAEDASLSSLALGKLAIEAGFPAGVVNILSGRGDVAGAALVRHPGVDKVSFTGSTRVGKEIGGVAGAALKKHSLELGGKCAAIVMDDADLDWAAAGLAGASFGNAGQICVASARILAHRSVHDALIEKLGAQAKVKRPGSTFDADATIGPIINARQHARIADLLDDARGSGATLSGPHAVDAPGYFLNPVIMSGLGASARLNSEETFGPVVAVESFDDLDDAIARANDTPYGLAGSIWTQRWRDANRATQAMRAGTVYVNCHAFADPAVPMGGLKASGIGLEGGREGLESYLVSKTTLALV
jgi:phenylacetaldehyde dehydrogenase